MINVMDLLVVLNSIILLGVCVVYFREYIENEDDEDKE